MDRPTVPGQQVAPIPQRTVGPYHVMAQLGLSPLGPVYLARLAHKETLFALKLLAPLPPEEMARLRQDAALLDKTDHPGLVRPADMGMDRGRVYVVTEHIPGTTLREQLDRRGPLGARQAAQVVADVAEALQAAHDAGVVHRHLDLTTVVVDGRDGRAKLQDFGLTRDPRRPAPPGQAPFLPAGWAPEQVRGERADARADVYALGAVLYELLTGSPPFEGHSWAELSQEILAGDPEPPGDLAQGVPRRVERACLEAMAPAPDDRPTAAELAAELRGAGEAAGGASRGLLAAAVLLAVAGTAGGVGWALVERGGRTEALAELATVTSRAQATEADLQGQLSAARTQAADKARADQARLAELADREKRLRDDLDRLRTSANQQAAALSQAQSAQRGAQERSAELAAAAGGALAPALDALAAELEGVEGGLLLRARLLRARRRDDDLLQLIGAQRARGPVPPALALLEAATLEAKGDALKARDVRAALASLGPDDPYGQVGALAGREEMALEDLDALRRAAERAPKDPELQLFVGRFLGAVLAQVRDQAVLQQVLPALIQLHDQAVAAAPFDSTALTERGRFLQQLFGMTGGRQRELLARAYADLRAAREIAPTPLLWAEVGQVMLNLGQTDAATGELLEARHRAEQARELSVSIMAQTLLGVARLAGGDEDGAVQAWVELIRQHPQQQGAYGFLQFLSKLSQPAQQRLVQALPPEVRAQLQRGGGGAPPPRGPGPGGGPRPR